MAADKMQNFMEARLAEDLLLQAFSYLLDTGRAARLGITGETPVEGTPLERAASSYARRQTALHRRTSFARTAILFSALAVEAQINLYIAVAAPHDAKALDDLSTVNKLLVAPKVASGHALFFDDRAPLGDVRSLFRLRNRVVHPKAGKQAVVGAVGIADFTPKAAATGLLAAAKVVRTIDESLPESHRVGGQALDVILENGAWLRDASRGWTDELPKPPGALAKALKRALQDLGRS